MTRNLMFFKRFRLKVLKNGNGEIPGTFYVNVIEELTPQI